VHIGCEDAVRFIERWDSPQAIFYCDPPYPNTDCGHYGGYSLADWQRLCDTLDNIQGSYILSNYPQPIEPQTAQQRVEIAAVMSATKVERNRLQAMPRPDAKRTEVLWICDRSSTIRSDLNPVLDALFPHRASPMIPAIPKPLQQLSLF
jgi:DNA adenine methylase